MQTVGFKNTPVPTDTVSEKEIIDFTCGNSSLSPLLLTFTKVNLVEPNGGIQYVGVTLPLGHRLYSISIWPLPFKQKNICFRSSNGLLC